ncbi:MAG: hypothetical protein ACEQSR_15780 [Candidatus Methylacidiphilales bacterium]
MNKISVLLTVVVLLFTFFSVKAKGKSETAKNELALQSTSMNKSNVLLKRLEIIKEMDKSQLNKEELNSLLAEVRVINKQLLAVDGGIFISAGALIVILIVLLFLI